MIYIYYGQDKNNIDFEKSNLLSNKVFIQIDFDDNHEEIIDAISQSSLFDTNDYFLINNASFFSNKKNDDSELIKNLIKSNKEIYCFNYDEKIDLSLPNVKYHKITKFNNLSKQKLVSQLLNKLQINFDSIQSKQYFESLLDNDPFVINNELNKLALFSNNITKAQIENSISPFSNPNIFKLMTFLLMNDKTKLIKLYESLIFSKFLPMDLITILNTQLLNLKIYKVARNNHWTNNDIINKLHFNQFAIMQLEALNTSVDKINKLIDELWELEYNMKHNSINQYLGLKFFLTK